MRTTSLFERLPVRDQWPDLALFEPIQDRQQVTPKPSRFEPRGNAYVMITHHVISAMPFHGTDLIR